MLKHWYLCELLDVIILGVKREGYVEQNAPFTLEKPQCILFLTDYSDEGMG